MGSCSKAYTAQTANAKRQHSGAQSQTMRVPAAAADGGHDEMCRLLINARASVDTPSGDRSLTPLQIARENGHDSTALMQPIVHCGKPHRIRAVAQVHFVLQQKFHDVLVTASHGSDHRCCAFSEFVCVAFALEQQQAHWSISVSSREHRIVAHRHVRVSRQQQLAHRQMPR